MSIKRVVSLAIVCFMLVVLIPLAVASNISTPEATATPVAQQAPLVNCSQVRISLNQVRVTCSAAGVVVLNTVVTYQAYR